MNGSRPIFNQRPTLVWEATPRAQEYWVYVNDGTGVRINQWVSSEDVNCAAGQATCSLVAPVELNIGTTRWWLRARNEVGTGNWSLERRFMINIEPVDPIWVTAVVQGDGGRITPASLAVEPGETASFTLEPDTGYAIDQVTGCGAASRLDDMMYTTEPITEACTVTATFVATQDGRYLPLEDGSIIRDTVTGLEWQRCSVGQTWDVGTQQCSGIPLWFTWSVARDLTADGGFRTPTIEELRTLVYCSNTGRIGIEESYVPCGDFGTFDSPTIMESAFPGTPAVNFWSSSPFQGFSDYAWYVRFFSGGDNAWFKDYSAWVRLVRDEHPLDSVVVTATAGGGGRISPDSRSVTQGAAATFSVEPDEGYVVDSVTGCGNSGHLDGTTYITGPISEACTLHASFVHSQATMYSVSATAGTGGTITPSSVMVASGATTQFELTVETDYLIESVGGCGNDGNLDGITYTTGPITEACTITAVFALQNQDPTPPSEPPARPVLLQPSQGSSVSTRPTLTWEAAEGAQEYLLYINDGTGVRINDWFSLQDTQCGSGQATCSLVTPVELNPGTTRWWVRARNVIGLGVWSLERRFSVDGSL